MNFFPNDGRLQRSSLLLLFNVVYSSRSGKERLVQSGGVKSVIKSISRALTKDKMEGETIVIHGMGVMFDLLRMSQHSEEEDTCLNAVAVSSIRRDARVCGFKEVLEEVETKGWGEGAQVVRMAEAMKDGM